MAQRNTDRRDMRTVVTVAKSGPQSLSLTTAFSRRHILRGMVAALAAGALAPNLRSMLGDTSYVGAAAPPAPTTYGVPGVPFDTVAGYTTGPADPGAVYGINRQFFPISTPARWGVVWQSQDGADKGQIYTTWFGGDPSAANNTAAMQKSDDRLAAAASDDAGNIYSLTIQTGDGSPSTPRRTTLTRFTPDGSSNPVTLDAGPTGLNMVNFGDPGIAAMQAANGMIAVMIGRTMTQSADGLNHEGGIARVYDATTLALVKDYGQSAGHSWASVLTRNAAGQFVAVEISDNFPRGIQLHRFDTTNKTSRVVYTYKTAHGTTPANPAGATYPAYPEISTGGTQYYKWSNDNQVYSELGGVAETAGGYLVVFAGERPSLDNSKAGPALGAPRNLAAVVVRKDFEIPALVNGDTYVTDDLMKSTGTPEESTYYDFQGGAHAQRNTGVVWLTDYPADKRSNATHIKVAPLSNTDVLLLWEVWSPSAYAETFAMVVRPEGAGITVVKPASSLGTGVRLNPRDDVVVRDGKVYTVSGNGANKQLLVTMIDPAAVFTNTTAQAPSAAPAPSAVSATVAPASIAVGGAATFTVTVPASAVAPGSAITLTLDPTLDMGTLDQGTLPTPDTVAFKSDAQKAAYNDLFAGKPGFFSLRGTGAGNSDGTTTWTVTLKLPYGLPDGANMTLKIPATALSVPATGTAAGTLAVTGGAGGAPSTQTVTVTVTAS